MDYMHVCMCVIYVKYFVKYLEQSLAQTKLYDKVV